MKEKMQAETAIRKFIFPLILLIAAFSFPSNAIAEESEQKIRIAVRQDTPKLSLKTSTHTIHKFHLRKGGTLPLFLL